MRNKIIFGDMVDYLRKQNDLSMEEFGSIFDKNKSTVSRWIKGTRFPKIEEAEEIANYFNIPFEVLIFGAGGENNIYTIYSKLQPPQQEKVYLFAEKQLEEQNRTQTVITLGKTAAGEPIYQEDIIEEEKEVSAIPSGADVALVVQGDSMEPDFENGTVVFYKKQPQVENGELAVVHIKDDGITFKKVLFDYDKKKIILRSLNDKYEDKVFDADNVNILGKVIT